jgi:hypothetical protein
MLELLEYFHSFIFYSVIVIIHQGREDIFLSRGSLFPEKRSFEGNKEAKLKIVFSTVVYILFFLILTYKVTLFKIN